MPYPEETHCMSARGGIYSPKDSKQWSSWGRWQLGLSYLGYGGNGLYGLDTINAYSPITDIAFGMGNVLTAAINTTDYFLGLYGLGITQGRFGNNVGESSLAQAVKDFGWIPSYSYGFTAGAYYKNMPVSATLGGYDTERFVAHDSDFTISQEDNLPRPNVRGIQVTSTNAPSHWNSSTQIISDYGNFFSAVIDSSTPFLWLPPTVCDNIASAFNLTYNETFQLYTLTNDQYQSYSTSDDHTFTLSLSSIDNHDNFGLPLSVPGVVNITLPIKAFVGTLQYPFQRETIKYGQPAIPYFMLRKSDNETNTILGRSFLQESYLITKFDSGTFTIHQAKFPDNPDKDVNLVGIKQPSNSPFPPPPRTEEKTGLTTAQMVGIAVGVVAFCTVLVAALCCYRRRRNQRKRREAALKEEEVRDSGSTITPDSPKTPVARILSKIARRKRSRRATGASTAADANPTEVPDSEIYELPAPPAPVELAAGGHDDTDSIMGDTEMGTDSTQNLSAYEIAKRKLDRQLAGPVPAYAPPADGIMPSGEKEDHIEVTTQPAHSFHNVSPVRSHEGLGTNSLPGTLPSPVSPRTDGYTNELPSPIDGTLQQYSSRSSKGSNKRRRKDSVSSPSSSSQSGPSSRSNSNHSNRSNGNAAPAAGVSFPLPQATFQRTPIEPSKVVCLGPLPDNVQLFRQKVASQAAASNEGGASQAQFNAVSHPSEGSLGSNYTDDEDRIVEEMTRQSMKSMNQTYKSHQSRKAPTIRPVLAPQGEGGSTAKSTHSSSSRTRKSARSGSNGSGSSSSQRRPGRIDGDELIHVPQMAEKRYSWEEGG